MTPPLPEDLRPSPSAQVLRRVLRALNRPAARTVLVLLALLALAVLFST